MSRLERARQIAQEFGFPALAKLSLWRQVNLFVELEVLVVVALDRAHLRKAETPDEERLSFEVLRAGDYPSLLARFAPGVVRAHDLARFDRDARADDLLLATFVESRLAGFTFAHVGGIARLQPGVRLGIPEGYLYNFSAFTLPEFRGRRHQGRRHFALLHSDECAASRGLLGYVLFDNLASRRGLRRSGYRPLGNLYHLRVGRLSMAWSGLSLRRAGLRLDGGMGFAAEILPPSSGTR